VKNVSGPAALSRVEVVGVHAEKKVLPLFTGEYQDGTSRRIIPAVAHAEIVA
jgi:hypothetical protein